MARKSSATRRIRAPSNPEPRLSVAEARQRWAEVIRGAQTGRSIVVTRNGEPVAAVVPIELLRRAERPSLSDAVARFRESVSPRDLDGPDPFADVRDSSPGRDVSLEE